MFRLKAFGTPALESQNGRAPAAAIQRRQLALLAIIASSGKAGIPRDKAALFLWPESESDGARHSLSQLLYSLRQALGADPVMRIAGNLQLNPTVMTSDVGDFDEELARGNRSAAVDLYKGPFLDGFNPPSSAEFDRWLDAERIRRTSQLESALEKLAIGCTSEGKNDLAIAHWKRLATIDPLNSRVALALMKAMDSAGDRAGALQHARVHSTLVRADLGVEPESVLRFVAELRTTTSSRQAVSSKPTVNIDRHVDGKRDTAGESNISEPRDSPVSDRTGNAPASNEIEARKHFPYLVPVVCALVVAILAIGAFKFNRTASRSVGGSAVSGSAVGGPTVVVMPFAVHADSAYAYLGEGLVNLLSADLNGAGDLRAVDPHALLEFISANSDGSVDAADAHRAISHFQASNFVLGDVTEAGGRLRISARLFSKNDRSAPLADATVEGGRGQLFELVDQLAAKLLAGRYALPRERLMRTAAATTRSLPALKSYLAGEKEFRSGRYPQAVEAFGQAVALDTTFALAYYRMSIAAEWEGRPDLQDIGAANALRFSGRLSDHDRMLVEALVARRQRNPDTAESIYRQIVAEFPDDVEAWYQLGEVLFHDNPARGRSFLESREAWNHVLALVPNDPDALLHLIRVLARDGSGPKLDSVIVRAMPNVTADQRLETEAFRAFVRGNAHDQDSMSRRLRTANTDVTWMALWRTAIYGGNVQGAKRLAVILTEPQQPVAIKSKGFEALMLLSLATGQWREAYAAGARVARAYPWSRDVGNLYFQSLGFMANDSAALRRLRSRFDAWTPPVTDESQLFTNPQGVLGNQFKAYSAGLLSVMLNESEKARGYADRIDAFRAPSAALAMPELLATIVRASALRRKGERSSALATLENHKGGIPIELGGALGVEPYFGWLRAELLRENNRGPEALRWYESRADLFISEVIYLAPAALRAGEIYESEGDRRNAVAKYRTFVSLWKDADPELQPLVADVRQRIRRLGFKGAID
ncbi:MAG: BTAD domain-containing putative transcriptional regulator [Gemmatimonadales bacterium]